MVRYTQNSMLPIIRRTHQHLYMLPHTLLRTVVAHYTMMLPFESDTKLLLMPDASGCMILSQEEGQGPRATCWGPTTRVVEVEGYKAFNGFQFFIEFLPGGAYALTGLPQKEVLDVQVDIQEIHLELGKRLMEGMEQIQDLGEFIQFVDKLLIKQLISGKSKQHLNQKANFISRNIEQVAIKELSGKMNYSTRQLSRICNETIGMSVKTYQQIVRVNQAVKLMKRPQMDLTQIAQYLGYYDQAHFIHDFQAVSHLTPKAYLKKMSVFYNEPYKL